MTAINALQNYTMEVDDHGVATVLFDRVGESVNSLSPEITEEMASIVERCETDGEIVGVVIGSAKSDSFIVGADIDFLASIESAESAETSMAEAHALFARLEGLTAELGKPVIAAIHGACLGGGLEVALACSSRICSDDEAATQLGQPEIRLGLIPGAGGTQRLPRLVGIASGLDMILTGRSIRPRKARSIGLVDEICPKEVLLDVARARVLEATSGRRSELGAASRVRSWLSPSHLQQLALEENPVGRKLLFSKAEEKMLATTGGHYPAGPAALRAIRVGIDEGQEAGYTEEIRQFGKVAVSPEAKALVSIFVATQAMKHESGVATEAEIRPVSRVGVLGGGLMGGGIAAVNTTNTTATTRIKEVDWTGVSRGLAHVKRTLDAKRKRRRLSRSETKAAMCRVTGTTDFSGFEHLDLVIEAVFEDLSLKQSILDDIEATTGDHTIFASNTSSLPISQIAARSKRPEQVIGMHYFSPVERMPLLEVVTTEQTADWVTATCVDFGQKQGKTVIVVNDGPGFYTTRVVAPYAAEFLHLVMEGALIEDIDAAITAFGMPVGPARLGDEVGIDVLAKIGPVLAPVLGHNALQLEVFDALIADGRYGKKSGRGFYSYQKGKRIGVDQTVYEVLGATPGTSPSPDEIRDRIVLQFVNEAVRCLEGGILQSARDGDIGAIMGLGWPPYTGGPFMYVDTVGADNIVTTMDALADIHGPRFEPAQLLRDHAASGDMFRA